LAKIAENCVHNIDPKRCCIFAGFVVQRFEGRGLEFRRRVRFFKRVCKTAVWKLKFFLARVVIIKPFLLNFVTP
jgi:hypothetical protein